MWRKNEEHGSDAWERKLEEYKRWESVLRVRDSGFYHDSSKEGFHSPTLQRKRKKKAKGCSGIEGCDFSFVGIIVEYLLSSLCYYSCYVWVQ